MTWELGYTSAFTTIRHFSRCALLLIILMTNYVNQIITDSKIRIMKFKFVNANRHKLRYQLITYHRLRYFSTLIIDYLLNMNDTDIDVPHKVPACE